MTERVRGAIFNILGNAVAGAAVLDLFAGSGSLGLEALSRGGRSCVFVDSAREAVQVLRRNVEALGFADRATILRGDAARVLARGLFDLVFVDPPYALAARVDGASAVGLVLRNLFTGMVLKQSSTVVLRAPVRSGPLWLPQGATVGDERRYGADVVRFLSVSAAAGTP